MPYDTIETDRDLPSQAVSCEAPPRFESEPPIPDLSDPIAPPIEWAIGELDAESGSRSAPWSIAGLRGTTGFLISLIAHAGLVLLLAFLAVSAPRRRAAMVITAVRSDAPASLDAVPLSGLKTTDPSPFAPEPDPAPMVAPGVPDLDRPAEGGAARSAARPDPASRAFLDRMMGPSHAAVGGGFEGRDPEWRGRLATAGGGSADSELAVETGLAWLAAHQRPDGGWRFDLDGPCRGQCRHPGTVGCTTGATGLALLPFLGAGYTHQSGKYRDVVDQGLYYLTSRMLVTPHGGDLQEGTMYAHGIATLTLCEAYAMTGDERWRPAAQDAVRFICHAQHERGGWRYVPGQPGDTTVFGWQIMALKSARLARLDVPSVIVSNAMDYLDSVQSQGGAAYGYQKPGNEPAPTSIGLLARMYHGWKRDDPRLARGVSILETLGPSRHDVYFDYYATQVLHHYGGEGWLKWNPRMRDYLIATQDQEGHERGSWHFLDKHGSVGGRLYSTAMCVMILEVYYRHMPMYGDDAIDVGF